MDTQKPPNEKTHRDVSTEDDSLTRLRNKTQEATATARELLKDSHQLVNQSQVLKRQARAHQEKARQVRGLPPLALETLAGPLTVPQVCRLLVVGERTLRSLLREPAFAPRIVEKNQRVGLWCKYVTLLPPDLVVELSHRFPARPPMDDDKTNKEKDAPE